MPLGAPGDLSFWAPNRGLLTVEGNDTIPRGIYSWNGQSWHQLATVCGGPGDTARIAWAGPTEFWVVSEPSLPRRGSGLALCRFKDGQVVGSWSTRVDAADPFRQMMSATCDGPNDCWFGGVGSQDALGERIGAFHLHWDGTDLETVYGPQGRGVSDMQFHGGRCSRARWSAARRRTAPTRSTWPNRRPCRACSTGSTGSLRQRPLPAGEGEAPAAAAAQGALAPARPAADRQLHPDPARRVQLLAKRGGRTVARTPARSSPPAAAASSCASAASATRPSSPSRPRR